MVIFEESGYKLIDKMGHLVVAHGHTHQNLRSLDKKVGSLK